VSGSRALARDVGATVGRHLVSVVVALAMTPVLVRTLGVARLGFWSLLGTSAFLVGLGDLGLSAATLRAAAGSDAHAAKRAARLGALVTSLVSIPLTCGCGLWLVRVSRDLPVADWLDARRAVVIALVASIANAAYQPARAYAQGQGRLGRLATARTVGALAQLVVTLGLLSLGARLTAVALGYVASVMFEGGLCIATTMDGVAAGGWPTRTERRALFTVGRSAMLTNVAVALCVRADVVILQRVTTLDVIGAYSVASRVIDQGFTLVKQVSSALVPRLGARSQNRGAAVRLGTMLIGVLASAPLAALAVAGAPFIVLWAGRAIDLPILPIALAWLAVASIVSSTEEVACSALALGGEYRSVTIAFGAGTATNILLSVAGAWAVGPGAVAAATAAGNLVMAVIVWRATCRELGWSARAVVDSIAPAGIAACAAGACAAIAARASLHPAGVAILATLTGLAAASIAVRGAWRAGELQAS